MAKVKESVYVRFNGESIRLFEGVEYPDNSKMVKENPSKFIFEKVLVEKVKTPKVEILIEEPVSELKVDIVDEVVESKPKRKRKSKKV